MTQERPRNIAHRGARSLAPENTLAAARAALDVGADMWELDVAASADGVLYLVHDDTLARTSDVATRFPERAPWPSHGFSWEEIQQLDFGSWFNLTDPFGQIAAGNVTAAAQASYVGERAPSLEEALRLTREQGWRVNVELKDLRGTPGDRFVVERAVEMVEALGMEEQVLLSSFNHDYLRRARAANPRIATGALVTRPVADPRALLRELGAGAYHPGAFAFPPGGLPPLRAAGVEVNVWTVNEEAALRAYVEAGASGIVTDFPQRLGPILAGSG